MLKRTYCILCLSLLTFGLSAQFHDRVLLFGIYPGASEPGYGGAIIDFNFQPPSIAEYPIGFNFGSYCAIGSDSTGRLLFYTNGIAICDASGELMMHGDSINFDELWVSEHEFGYPNGACSFVLPAPGLPNHYALFHMATRYNAQLSEYVNSPFYYTLIDMNGNNGKGRVVVKNQILLEGGLSYPVAVKHGNGRDWWVYTGEQNTNTHYRFLLDPSGVQGPFTQQYGPEPFYEESTGVNAVAPNGRIYVRVDQNNNLRIFEIDRCTGLLGNLRVLPFAPGFSVFQSEFSNDSRRLYLSSNTALMSVDLQAAQIAATLDTLALYDGALAPFPTTFWTAGRMADGKIYWATKNSTFRMHVVHQPDLPGQLSDFEQGGVVLPVYNSGTMCRFPNYQLGHWDQSPCDSLPQGLIADHFISSPYNNPKANTNDEYYQTLEPLGKNLTAGRNQPKWLPPDHLIQTILLQKDNYPSTPMKKSGVKKH